MSPTFRLFYHIGVLTLAVLWAFIWLKIPNLANYSLQLFGAVILGYFLIKRFNQANFWQLLPSPVSLEMALATLAFLLVIGATGNIHSPLFPLSFVHLFFLVLSAESTTTVILMLEILLFHYSLTPNIGMLELSYLSSLPIVMIFFLLAKDQFYRASRQQVALDQKTATIQKLQRVDQALESFILKSLGVRFLKPNTQDNTPILTTTTNTVKTVQVETTIELDLRQTETEAEAIANEITDTLDSLNHESKSTKS